jgi:hypothetical protein
LHVDRAATESGVNSPGERADFGVSIYYLVIQDSHELAFVSLEQFTPHPLEGPPASFPFIIWARQRRNVPLSPGLKLAVFGDGYYRRYRFPLVFQDKGTLSQVRFV